MQQSIRSKVERGSFGCRENTLCWKGDCEIGSKLCIWSRYQKYQEVLLEWEQSATCLLFVVWYSTALGVEVCEEGLAEDHGWTPQESCQWSTTLHLLWCWPLRTISCERKTKWTKEIWSPVCMSSQQSSSH